MKQVSVLRYGGRIKQSTLKTISKMNKSIKTALLAIIVIAAFLFGAATSQAQNAMPVYQSKSDEVLSVYRKALELNEGRFTDPNLIFVGDTVLFPAHYGPGIEAWVANEPTEGRHDSFWRLSEKYVAGQLVTVPADTMKVKIVMPVPEEKSDEAKNGKSWSNWLLAIAIILTGLFLVALFLNYLFKRPGNADSFQPVGGNIDAMPRENTLTLTMMRYLRPGERLINFRTGTLGNSLGKRRFAVNMEFGDNVRRDVWMNTGERVSTAIIEDANGNRRTQHLRNACSNGFGGGSFELPNGWFITYDQSEEAGRVMTESDGQGGQRLVVTPTTPAPLSTPTPAPFQSSLSSLVQVVQGLQMEKGSNVDINFKENEDEINLTIKIGKMRREKNK